MDICHSVPLRDTGPRTTHLGHAPSIDSIRQRTLGGLILGFASSGAISPASQAQASTVCYRLLSARSGRRSTSVATNIDFKVWADYLGDPPLATAFLDRLVDGAVILKRTARSYRADPARPVTQADAAD
jgi:hypothetical protein